MRFKAHINSPHDIIRLLHSLSTMGSRCAVLMTPKEWVFQMNDKMVESNSPQCFATLPIYPTFIAAHYFLESNFNNECLFEIDINNFQCAFKSTKEFLGQMITVRLSKKNGISILAFEMWHEDDGEGGTSDMLQDVPIKLLPHSKLHLYSEPIIQLQSKHCQIKLPEIKSFKLVLDRMETINDVCQIRMCNDGRLSIECHNEYVTTKTIYNDLAWIQSSNYDNNENENKVVAKVNIKFLNKVIASLMSLQKQHSLMCITQNHAITIHSRLNDGSRITFYICVYIDNDDNDNDNNDNNDDNGDENDDENDNDNNDDNEDNDENNDNNDDNINDNEEQDNDIIDNNLAKNGKQEKIADLENDALLKDGNDKTGENEKK